MNLESYVRQIDDFPKPGITFCDITTLLADTFAFNATIDRMVELCEPMKPDAIVGIGARGFLFASPMAYKMSKPLVPVRKAGKLPYKTYSASYHLEYGMDTLQIHEDALSERQRVLIVDDLLATGGTVSAASELVNKCGAYVVGYTFLIELSYLNGRERLQDADIVSLIKYDAAH